MYDSSKAVTIQWTGLLDWTTGLDYWTGLLDSLKLPLEENVFQTAGLTSSKNASGQVATSVVPRAEGALQTPTVS